TSQINGIVTAAEDFFDPNGYHTLSLFGREVGLPTVIAALLTTLLVGLVLAGGIKRIASVATLLVPFMAALYTLLCLWLILLHFDLLPFATALILRSAFAPGAVLGGAAGITFQKAIRYGLGRGIFSNEAGMGSDPIAAAAAKTESPAKQGLISMLGPFLDTVLMCTLTGYAVVLTGTWQQPDLSGAEITLHALLRLPLPAGLVSFLYMVCLMFFGFCSIIGWSYYGEQSLRYLLPCRGRCVYWFRGIFLGILLIGGFLTADVVWSLADIFCALMAVPNLVGLIGLAGEVFHHTS
ncbi:MAG: alanine:cation symporter family protein, partial [Clostridia bacterium]|nr:alanine:cation symporter family protein [Clostridia bacterium]